MANPIIDVQTNRFWQNWHSSKGIGGPVARFYTPHNEWSDGSSTPDKQFAPGLAGLQSIVQQAEQDGKRVRALGSGWSLSSAPFVDDYLINTQRLSSWFIGFKTPTLVDESRRDDADKLDQHLQPFQRLHPAGRPRRGARLFVRLADGARAR